MERDGAVGIREVAASAGVSVGTVSNVLNRSHLVAESTRLRVQEAIDALGFVRNESARQLRAGTSRTVGLIVMDVANPFFTDVARGVEDAASQAGLSVILCNSDDDAAKQERYLSLLAEQRVQGLLIVPVDASERRLSELRARGIPVVLLDRRAARRNFCSVSVDDVAGGEMAVEHLLERGHRRVGFVGGGKFRQVSDRHSGAEAAFGRRGVPAEYLTWVRAESLNVAGGRRAAASFLDIPASRRPTAVFCVNDLLALGFLVELTKRGVDVPGQVALVGYDDIELAEAAVVPLTSVRQPRQHLGRTAMSLLLEETGEGAHRHQQVVFAPELIVRRSSEAPRRGRNRRG